MRYVCVLWDYIGVVGEVVYFGMSACFYVIWGVVR